MLIRCFDKYLLYLLCYKLTNQFFVPYIPLPHWLHVWGTYPYHTGYMFWVHTLTTLVTCLGLHSISHICVCIVLLSFLHIYHLLRPCHTYETHWYGMVEVKKICRESGRSMQTKMCKMKWSLKHVTSVVRVCAPYM